MLQLSRPEGMPFGYEIRGVAAANLSEATRKEIARIFAAEGVVFLHGLDLSPAQHVDFSRQFG